MSNEIKDEIKIVENMSQEEREEYFAKCECSKYVPCPEWHVCPYNYH